MMDLRDHLEHLAGPAAAPTAADIDADLARGRRALRRRRAGRTVAGSVLGVAAIAAAFSLAGGGSGVGAGVEQPDRRPAVVAARLVAYEGAQPKGFTVDKVPAGWFVQSDEKYGLSMAPDSAKNPPPGVDPSKAPIYDPRDYRDKIVIYLESRDQDGPTQSGTAVKVGDLDGTLVKSLPGMTPDGPVPTPANGDSGWSLWVELPSGVHVIVQFWQGLGFSQDQMVELAAGVHVHAEAEQSAG